jgi:hypothetical protein
MFRHYIYSLLSGPLEAGFGGLLSAGVMVWENQVWDAKLGLK